jgi:DNA polymerase phi
MHEQARESQSNEISNVAQTVNLYLTKTALSLDANVKTCLGGKLLDIYRTSLLDYLTRSACRLRHEFMIDAFRRFPMLGWHLRTELLEKCRPGVATRAFRQMQAMSMLQAVLTQLVQRAEKNEILGFVPEISGCFCEIITDSTDADSTSALNSNRIKDTIKFMLQVARISVKLQTRTEKLQSIWKTPKLVEAAQKLHESERFKASTSIHDLMRRLLKVVQNDLAEVKKKRKKDVQVAQKRPAPEAAGGDDKGLPPTPTKKAKASQK